MIDITDAVTAAAKAEFARRYPDSSWDEAPPIVQFHAKEFVLPHVEAAVDTIEAAARAALLEEQRQARIDQSRCPQCRAPNASSTHYKGGLRPGWDCLPEGSPGGRKPA
jgi:hypothetical protein